ncbi:MAG TPA: hypothetical protein ACFCUY_13300 [Xenococcaceae cyanobacterium]
MNSPYKVSRIPRNTAPTPGDNPSEDCRCYDCWLILSHLVRSQSLIIRLRFSISESAVTISYQDKIIVF